MSNVDTLLDFGESEAPPVDTNQTNPVASDPFDPLSPSTESSGSVKSPDQTNLLDPFDPFAGPTDMMSSDTGPTTNGEAMSNNQIKTMEQQFDDLLGGFSSTSQTKETTSAPTGDLLGDFEEDTEVIVTKQTETDEDGTTTVVTETRTEEMDDGGIVTQTVTTTTTDSIEEVTAEATDEPVTVVTATEEIAVEGIEDMTSETTQEPVEGIEDMAGEMTQEPVEGIEDMTGETTQEPATVATEEADEENIVNGTEGSESGSEHADRMSTASDKASEGELFLTSSKEGNRLEDQLSDYQPPKQYVKKEEKESRASPTVFITDSRSRESTPSGASDTSAEYSVKPSKPFGALRASWGTPTGDSDNQCKACGKRVYAMEKMLANKAVYHKTCFRCCECKSVLRVGNFAAMEGEIYCKPHFMSLFKTKGNYDEGFGRQRHSALWINKEGTPGKDDKKS